MSPNTLQTLIMDHRCAFRKRFPLWFLLSEPDARRCRADPEGVQQAQLEPGPAAGSVRRPGEDEAGAADGGGRPLGDGVHALLLGPTEVEPDQNRVTAGPKCDLKFDSWKINFLSFYI